MSDTKAVFMDLGIDDIVYRLDKEELTFTEVEITGVSRGDGATERNYLSFQHKNGYLFKAYNSHSEDDTSSRVSVFFVKKEDMKKYYEKLMIEKINHMTKVLGEMQ